MTLDTSKPNGAEDLVTDLDNYQRETRIEVNALWAAVSALGWSSGLVIASMRNVTMAAAQEELIVGTDVSDIPLETVNLTGDAGANTLKHITNARNGHIRVFIFQDSYITVEHLNTKIMLNGDADLDPEAGDVLALINIGGNPDTAVDGYWRELYRTLKV